MTMITRITDIKNLGIFRDFKWPSDLPDFARYNLFYGWNGTGKTTLSNLLRSLQTKRKPGSAQVRIDIEGKTIREDEFESEDVPIRVFNREFIEENVFTINGEVAPIFIIGKENIEKQKQVEQFKVCLDYSKSRHDRYSSQLRSDENAFEQYCTTQASSIKSQLTAVNSDYRNYNKGNYKRTAEELLATGDIEQFKLTEVERESLRKQHTSTEKPTISKIVYEFPDGDNLNEEVSRILKLVVTSSVIETLRNDPDLAMWIKEGLNKHNNRDTTTCLFCEQKLPDERIDKLNAHFSKEYDNLLRDTDDKIREVQVLISSINGIKHPNKAELYDRLAGSYETELNNFLEELKQVKSALEQFVLALNGKKAAPFEQLDIELSPIEYNADALERVNNIIGTHNTDSEEFSETVKEARKLLEKAIVADSVDAYKEKKDAVENTRSKLERMQVRITGIKNRIAELERDIVQHRELAEELNSDLLSYLGHGEITLETKATGYQIMRKGDIAKGLSEGEKTAIALLYFLKSLKDRDFTLSNGIVVLDDPVSSLDSNCLFCAFGFIKDRTEDAGQLLILTHNFSLFDQVRNWLHNLRGEDKKNKQFYMIDCETKDGERCSHIRALDPLLRQYKSEYHYLFKRVHETANSTEDRSLDPYYMMPNVARRLLETFLAFRYPNLAGQLWKIMQQVEYDTTKKTRILRFLHTHSHSSVVGEHEHDPSILSETPAILKDMLDLMKSEDERHFDSMEKLVTGINAKTE
ncbi:MAG TPA: AAA family ATPase [candidate division Zixibacteria bacterium]|nr:AAA family ATPase [candidate division Zixibacteria bacterium]